MAVDSIRQIFKGMFAAHATASSAVPPAVSADDWAQLRKKNITFLKPIADASAGATYEWPIFHNHWTSTLTITAVKLTPFAALTAHDTDYKTVALNRRVAAGAATVIASVTTKITGGTGNWVALTPFSLTLSSTAADLVVPTLGDLSLHLVHSGSGVAVPVCAVTIEYFET
jgi:hypothetical protein